MTFPGWSLDSIIIFKPRYLKPTHKRLMWDPINVEMSRRHYFCHWVLDLSFWYITMQGGTDAAGNSLKWWHNWGSYRQRNIPRSHGKLSGRPGIRAQGCLIPEPTFLHYISCLPCLTIFFGYTLGLDGLTVLGWCFWSAMTLECVLICLCLTRIVKPFCYIPETLQILHESQEDCPALPYVG